MIHGFELVIRGFELVAHGFKLVTCGFELVLVDLRKRVYNTLKISF